MANDNNIQPMTDDSQIVLYQPDESISLQVKIEEDTVWLTQAQMVELFGSSKANISEHITNIYQQGELVQSATVRKFRTVRKEGNQPVRWQSRRVSPSVSEPEWELSLIRNC